MKISDEKIKQLLFELLCVVHRDGGHYITNHGVEKATEDAIKRIYNERSNLENIISSITFKNVKTNGHPEKHVNIMFRPKNSKRIISGYFDINERYINYDNTTHDVFFEKDEISEWIYEKDFLSLPAVVKKEDILDLDSCLSVGYGECGVIKDGKKVFSDIDSDKDYTAQYFEEVAKGDPDHTWVMFFNLPMSSSVYTRKSDGVWILTHTDDGFV